MYSSSQKLCHTATQNSHAVWDHTVLPATRQRWESRLYLQPKQVLDLAYVRVHTYAIFGNSEYEYATLLFKMFAN